MMGARLTPQNVLAEVAKMQAKGYIVQRKLNGDRGVLEAASDGELKLWNRYGSLYGASTVRLDEWSTLPIGTIIDGEIFEGHFYPFECIQVGRGFPMLYLQDNTEGRISGAKLLCQHYSVEYLYDVTNEWLVDGCGEYANPHIVMWEGVVCKLANAKYVTLKKPDHESPTWVKLKWC